MPFATLNHNNNRQGQGRNGIFGYYFVNPYYDIASTYVPSNIKEVFKKCEFLYYNGSVIRPATDRVSRYFVTNLKFGNEENDNIERLRRALEKKIKIKSRTSELNTDGIVYGNAIVSLFLPFDRFLVCPDHPMLEMSVNHTNYDFENFSFYAFCPLCQKKRKMRVRDKRSKDISRIHLHRWNPREIDINYDIFSGQMEYYWKIPPHIINNIKSPTMGTYKANKLMLNNIPLEVIKAVKDGHDFKIDEKFVHHYRHPSLAGVHHQWGFPLFLNIIKLDYHVALLRKANEVIANDFIVPFRILSPAPQGSTDPIQNMSYRNFVTNMNQMVQDHRYDPASVKVSPIPVQYQAFGGEAKALDTTNLIKLATEEQLHALNYPAELFYSTLHIQTMPTALRIFENNWSFLIDGQNDFVQWVADHVCDYMGWKRETVSYTNVTTADDIEKRQVFMNLAASGQISLATALDMYGLDLKEELKSMANQQKVQQDIQRELQEDQAKEMQMAPPPEQQMSALDINSQADYHAQRLINAPDPGIVRQELKVLRENNETLHALVRQRMDQLRSQMGTDQYRRGGVITG